MERRTVSIPNISCGHCVETIRRELGEIAGVNSVDGDAASKTITIAWNSPASWSRMTALLTEIGYPPQE